VAPNGFISSVRRPDSLIQTPGGGSVAGGVGKAVIGRARSTGTVPPSIAHSTRAILADLRKEARLTGEADSRT